jgi:hypothetical protein
MSLCTCAPCGRVFTSLSGFDAHQERRYDTPQPVVCHDPATRGLVADEKTGRWHFPGNGAARPWDGKMRAEQVPPSVIGYPPAPELQTEALP